MKLAVFDFDSTLVQAETIVSLAKPMGTDKEVHQIVGRAMSGSFGFFKSITAIVTLIEGLEVTQAKEICSKLPITPGAAEAVKGLQARGYTVVCFSGGFTLATEPICKQLGITAQFANHLHQENGVLTGHVNGDMMDAESKGIQIKKLQDIMGITRADTVCIGDGANDISMFREADCAISFNGKDIVNREATHIINSMDLNDVLDIVDLI